MSPPLAGETTTPSRTTARGKSRLMAPEFGGWAVSPAASGAGSAPGPAPGRGPGPAAPAAPGTAPGRGPGPARGATPVSGRRRTRPANRTPRTSATPSRTPPTTGWPVASRTIANASEAAARASTAAGGVTPKNLGSAAVTCTGTGPVSCGGTSCTTVSSVPSTARTPHSGQKRARFVSFEPQFAQVRLAGGTHLLSPSLGRLALEGTKRLGRLPPQRPDHRPAVLVRDLARTGGELELLQRPACP